MKLLRKAAYLALAALLVTSCGGAGNPIAAKPTPDPLNGVYVIKGGGGALDNVNALTKGFSEMHPSVVWRGLDDVGSDAGVSLTTTGDVDLGFISRELKAAEVGKVLALPIGASGTAVAVSASSTVKALTKDQVAKIFLGQVTDWKDVGGLPGKIRVLLREPASSTRSAFESYFFDGKAPTYAKDAIEVFQIDETIKAIASFKDSIGMMTMNARTFTEPTIRMVSVDGISATRETLADGTYKIRRPLYFVYSPDATKVKPAIKVFLDYVRGPEGQKILTSL